MTSAVGGGRAVPKKQTKETKSVDLSQWQGGEGVKKSKNFTDVIYGSNLTCEYIWFLTHFNHGSLTGWSDILYSLAFIYPCSSFSSISVEPQRRMRKNEIRGRRGAVIYRSINPKQKSFIWPSNNPASLTDDNRSQQRAGEPIRALSPCFRLQKLNAPPLDWC